MADPLNNHILVLVTSEYILRGANVSLKQHHLREFMIRHLSVSDFPTNSPAKDIYLSLYKLQIHHPSPRGNVVDLVGSTLLSPAVSVGTIRVLPFCHVS